MNQGRIWCVVHPTVGLPLLLGSVALTSLAVHTAVMTHTTWMGTYWMGRAARVAAAPPQASLATGNGTAFSMKVSPAPATGAQQASFIITVSPASPAATALAATPAAADTGQRASTAPVHTASAD